MQRGAEVSSCGQYRFLLTRVWDEQKPRALVIMLNPSNANAHRDDPTIRSCVRLLDHLGYGSFEVVNLFPYITPKPHELLKIRFPAGVAKRNAKSIVEALKRCSIVICAWGANEYAERTATELVKWLTRVTVLRCFDITQSGAPKHPLYVKTGTQLKVYRNLKFYRKQPIGAPKCR